MFVKEWDFKSHPVPKGGRVTRPPLGLRESCDTTHFREASRLKQ